MNVRRVALAVGLALGLFARAAQADVLDAQAADTSAAVTPAQEPVRYERWDPIGDRARREQTQAVRDSLAFEHQVRGAARVASLTTNSLLIGGGGLLIAAAAASGEPGAAVLGWVPMVGAGLVGPAAGWAHGGRGRRALVSIAAHTAYLIAPTVIMVAVTDPGRWREPENVDVVGPTMLASFVVNTVLAYHENHTIEPTLRREAAGPHAILVPAMTLSGEPALAVHVNW